MNLRAGLAMIFSALRSPLGRLAALSAAVGVFGFALMGETPVSGAPVPPVASEWRLPGLPAAPGREVQALWREGPWASQRQAGAAPADELQAPRITLLGVFRRAGRLEALLAGEDGLRFRRAAGESLPGGGTLIRVAPTEAAWTDAEGKETVARLLAQPGAAPITARRPARR